jgi:hypothetical protein
MQGNYEHNKIRQKSKRISLYDITITTKNHKTQIKKLIDDNEK